MQSKTISLRRFYRDASRLTAPVLVRNGDDILGTFFPTGTGEGPTTYREPTRPLAHVDRETGEVTAAAPVVTRTTEPVDPGTAVAPVYPRAEGIEPIGPPAEPVRLTPRDAQRNRDAILARARRGQA